MRAMRVATRPMTCPAASTTNHPPPCSIVSVSRPRGTYVRMCSVTPFRQLSNVDNIGYTRFCQSSPVDESLGCEEWASDAKLGAPSRTNTPMNKFDIDSLSEEDLIELNHKIVARLRFLSQMRSHSSMLDFRIGERVKFRPDGRPEITGILTQYNKKTVTVITDSGEHWNVAPGLLSKVEPAQAGSARREDIKVVPLSNRSDGK